MNTKSPELYRTIHIVRSLLYLVLVALIILWIRNGQNLEPWTVLVATVIAILEAVNLVQQFQPSPAARRSRQLESLVLRLKQSPVSSKYVEPVVSYLGSDGQPFNSVIDKCPHFVLTGVPGTGKTTFLHQQALALAQKCLDNLDNDSAVSLPFLVYLSKWTSGKSLPQVLKDQWPFDGDPVQIMATTKVWFLADGLDELSGDVPQKIAELRRWLDSGNAPYRAVFTCRSVRYDDNLRLPLPEVTIRPELSEDQIRTFAHQYLDSDADRFLTAYAYEPPSWAKEAIQELSLRTPLVLTVLLQAFKDPGAPRVLRNPGAQVDLYLREVWNRELRRNSTTRFSFEEMVSACTRFMESSLWSLGGFTYDFLSDRQAIDLLALGLLEHAHRQRSERSKKWHAIGVIIWVPLFFLKTLFPWAVRILIAVPSYFIPASLRHARQSRSPVEFGRIFVQSIAEQLSEFLPSGPWVYLGLRQYVSEIRELWPEVYFEIDTTPAYWLARRRARHLLNMLVDARILRGRNKTYAPSMPLVREFFLAQGERLRGASLDPALFGSSRGNSAWTRLGPAHDAELVILAGIAENPEEFITRLSKHDPYAATLCIASGIDVGPLVRESVLDSLLELLTKLINNERYCLPLIDAYTALRYFSDPSTVNDLIDIVEAFGFDEVANDLIEIITDIGPDAVPSLIRRLPSCASVGVRVAITCLSRIGDVRAISPIQRWITDNPAGYYELWALAALSHLGGTDEQQLFMDELLPLPHSWEHRTAYTPLCEPWRAYWETSPNRLRTLDEFLGLLKDASHETELVPTCFHAILARRDQLSTPFGSQLVAAYRKETSVAVKSTLARVLAALNVTEACAAFMNDIYNPDMVLVLIPALGDLGCARQDAVNALVGYLQHSNPRIRSITLEALDKIRAPSATLAISRLLSDAAIGSYNRRICDIAAEALSEIDSPVARERASTYYLSQLRETIPDSGKWFEIELRLERLDRKNSIEIERIRRDLTVQQGITSSPSQTIEVQSGPVFA